jgi:hypothetical protein
MVLKGRRAVHFQGPVQAHRDRYLGHDSSSASRFRPLTPRPPPPNLTKLIASGWSRGGERGILLESVHRYARLREGGRPLNAAVSLVRTYLKLNSYFTATELPVIKKGDDGLYFEVTDIDVLALRFPRAGHIVAQGRPGPLDDFQFPPDPGLEIPTDAMDLIIGEVKAGRPKLNPHMRSEDTLYRALVRFGFCPPSRLEKAVDELRETGETWVKDGDVAVPSRIRIVAFGDGEEHEGDRYTVVPLLKTLGLLHLLEKLEGD